MKVYLNISKEYFAYSALYKILRQLGLRDVVINKNVMEAHLEELRGKFNFEHLNKDLVFNLLREDIDLCVVCTDGEDKQTNFLMKYCVKHRIPMLLLTNLVEEDNCLLEVV